MPLKAKIKLTGDVPWRLEHSLVTKGGFRVFSRKPREFLILEKVAESNFKPVVIAGELSEQAQKDLTYRMNNIVNMFMDPESHMYVIKQRLANICLTLSPLEKDFVQKWIDENLAEDQ